MPITETGMCDADIDYMNCVDKEEEEWKLIKDLRQEEIEENCFQVFIKDLKTGKKILNLTTDQITLDSEFSMETGYDVLVIKAVISDEYIQENGDKDYTEDLELFSKKYLAE